MAIKKCIIANDQPIQLLNKASYPATQTINGVTFTNNGDGSYTVSGTATNISNLYISGTIVCEPNKKYLLSGCPAGGSWSTFNIYVTQANDSGWLSDTADNGGGVIFTSLSNANKFSSVVLRIDVNQTVNITFKPQLIALTETFVAGNEPTTAAAYKTKFPNDIYPYNINNILNSYKKAIKIADVCQLVNLETKTFTNNGITWAFNSDGSITINGQLTQDYSACYVTPKEKSQVNHYYYAYSEGISASFPRYFTFYPQGFSATWVTDYADAGYIVRADESGKHLDFYYAVASGNTTTYTDFVVHPQIIDLTESFGAGIEPQTVAEFRAKFPNSFYPYAPKCFVYTYEDRIIVKANGSYV